MSYGFEKAKKLIQPAEPDDKKLDITGLNLPAPVVTPEQEAAAVAKGDALGFGSREIQQHENLPQPQSVLSQASPRIMRSPARQRPVIPTKSVLVKGPQEVLDRFVLYTNESGAGAYWEAIDYLLKAKGR
jgi:hypothetical protein